MFWVRETGGNLKIRLSGLPIFISTFREFLGRGGRDTLRWGSGWWCLSALCEGPCVGVPGMM